MNLALFSFVLQEATIELDLVSFLDASVKGIIPIIFVIVGLVEWFKRFKDKEGNRKFTDNKLLIISMTIGLLLGAGWMVSNERPPSGGDWWTIYVYWFAVVVYGFGLGIVASGIYDATVGKIKDILSKPKTEISQ
jgi:amino acid transporter